MSFGGAGQGNIRYSIILDDTVAVQKIGQFKTAINGITQPSQALATNIGTLNTNFASIGTGLTKTNTGFTQTGVASKTLATNLTGVNTGFTTLGTGINGLATPTRTLTTNMGALGNNFKLLGASETQTVTQTNAFKTGITALTTPTQQVSTNMKSLVGNLGPLSSNFQKTTGAAKDMVVQQNNLATGSTSLGSKVKSAASQYGQFAVNMGTVVTSAIQLIRNYRDLKDTQIAVDKSAKKLSTAHEAVDKLTVKLAADTIKYGKNSKEVKQDTLDLSQATQTLGITEKVHGENLERQSDAYQDFSTSIIPTVISTVGTASSGFSDLGKNIKAGIPGIKNFGGSIKAIPTSLIGIGSGAIAASGGLLAFASNAGPIAGLINNIRIAIDLLPKTFSLFTGDISTRIGIVKQWMDGLKNLSITGGLAEILDKLVGISPELDRVGKSMKNMGNDVKTVPPSMNTFADSSDAVVNRLIVLRTQLESGKIGITKYSTEVNKLALGDKLPVFLDLVNQRFKESKIVIDGTVPSLNKSQAAFGSLAKLWEVEGGKAAAVAEGFGASLDTLKAKFLALSAAQKDLFGTKFTQNVIQFTDLLKNWGGGKITQTIEQTNQKLKEHAGLVAQTNTGVKNLWTTWEKDAAGEVLKMDAKAIEDARKKLEAFNKKIAEGVQAVGVTFKVKDNVEKFMKEIKKNLPNKIEKKIDMKLDFRGNVKDATTAFNSFLETATTMDEKTADGIVAGIIKTIDEKFKGKKGAFAGLRAQLETEMKNPNTVQILKNNLANGDYTAAGKGIFSSVSAGIAAAANAGGGLASLWEGSTGKGIVIPAPVTTAFDTGIATVKTTASTAVTQISTSLAKVSAINIPTPNESTYQKGLQLAINNAGQTVKIITSTLKKIASIQVPPPNEKTYQKGLQLAINNAAQTVKLISKELKKIGSIKVPAPKFNDFNSALDQAVSDAKRAVRDINNALKKINKPSSGGGTGQQGAYGGSKGDTSGIFVGGSKSDSGGTGGDTILNVNIMDETIMRKITARSGKNRFTLGV